MLLAWAVAYKFAFSRIALDVAFFIFSLAKGKLTSTASGSLMAYFSTPEN